MEEIVFLLDKTRMDVSYHPCIRHEGAVYGVLFVLLILFRIRN
ncbi:hypothetical protein PAAL109150_01465 [Paenibacillus alkaliterrae]